MLLAAGAVGAGAVLALPVAVATLDDGAVEPTGALDALGEGVFGVHDHAAERRSAKVPARRALDMAPMLDEPRAGRMP